MSTRNFLPIATLLLITTLLFIPLSIQTVSSQQSPPAFTWPEGKRAAVSLSFDDARASQVDVGTSILDRHGVKATFFIVPGGVERRLEGWRKAVRSGHEIGNHSLNHPCSGNFSWSRQKALEDYTLERIHAELVETNRRIKELLGVEMRTFAYPCGQTFVGRGLDTRSYVPIVSALFTAGRGWLGEAPNDPEFCDLAQITGIATDGKEFEQILPILEEAKEAGHWVVFAGHDIGPEGRQTTRVRMLEKLLPYLRDPANGFWVAPVGDVAEYVAGKRKAGK